MAVNRLAALRVVFLRPIARDIAPRQAFPVTNGMWCPMGMSIRMAGRGCSPRRRWPAWAGFGMAGMKRFSGARCVAVAGLGVLLAGGPALQAVAAPGAAAGIPGYAVTTIKIRGGAPGGAAVDPATGMVYVPTSYRGVVSVIDESTSTVAHEIRFGAHSALATAVDAKTDTVYVGLTDLPELAVLDGATDAVTASYSLPGAPVAITLNPGAGVLYVAYGNSVSAIDTASGTLTSTVDLGVYNHPWYLAVDPATGTVYAAGTNDKGTGTVWVLDTGTTLAVTRAIPVGTGLLGVAVNVATDKVYVADVHAGVYVIDGATDAVTHINTRSGANGVAVDGATNTVFAAMDGRVAVIDGATSKVTMRIVAGSNAWHGGIVADPDTGKVYAAATSDVQDYVSALAPGISPVIISPSSATFTAGHLGTFTVTTSGRPAAAVAENGRLPAGVTFTPSPGTPGTAVLAGTPSPGSGGAYPVTISASNGVTPVAKQRFTLIIHQAPSITSASKAVFHAGVSRRFHITTRGFPVPALTEKGRLPEGFSFRASRNGTATITGHPVRSEIGKRFTVKILASNGIGKAATQKLTIVIRRARRKNHN